MRYTGNLNLLKPEDNDVYDIDHMNQNADILDKEVTNIYSLIGGEDGKTLEEVKKSIRHIKDVVVRSIDWKISGDYYTTTIKNDYITEYTSVDANFHLESLYDARYLLLTRVDKAGEVQLFARSKPDKDLKCDLVLMTEVI